MSFSGVHNHQHDYDVDGPGFNSIFTGKGPGRGLAVLGWLIAAFCFAGWVSIIFGNMSGLRSSGGPDGQFEILGSSLPSGVPLGVVYFLGFAAGGLLASVGSSMAKAGALGASRVGHLVVTVIILAAVGIGLARVLAGAPLAALKPHLSTVAASASQTPAQVVTSSARSATRGGLTMTVTRIENHGGRGSVQIRMVNDSGESLGMPSTRFRLTDATGRTYEAVPFGSDWSDQIGPGATQTGSMLLTKAVALGKGPLRAEFTTVYGLRVRSIAVTGIPSR